MQMLLRVRTTHVRQHMENDVEKKKQVFQKRMSVEPKEEALNNLVEGMA